LWLGGFGLIREPFITISGQRYIAILIGMVLGASSNGLVEDKGDQEPRKEARYLPVNPLDQ
jgi:hypothetical protein